MSEIKPSKQSIQLAAILLIEDSTIVEDLSALFYEVGPIADEIDDTSVVDAIDLWIRKYYPEIAIKMLNIVFYGADIAQHSINKQNYDNWERWLCNNSFVLAVAVWEQISDLTRSVLDKQQQQYIEIDKYWHNTLQTLPPITYVVFTKYCHNKRYRLDKYEYKIS